MEATGWTCAALVSTLRGGFTQAVIIIGCAGLYIVCTLELTGRVISALLRLVCPSIASLVGFRLFAVGLNGRLIPFLYYLPGIFPLVASLFR